MVEWKRLMLRYTYSTACLNKICAMHSNERYIKQTACHKILIVICFLKVALWSCKTSGTLRCVNNKWAPTFRHNLVAIASIASSPRRQGQKEWQSCQIQHVICKTNCLFYSTAARLYRPPATFVKQKSKRSVLMGVQLCWPTDRRGDAATSPTSLWSV
jgi:hypothetical protein